MKKVIIDAMGKKITIDNPTSVGIVLQEKGCKPFKFDLQINKRGTRKLARAFKKLG